MKKIRSSLFLFPPLLAFTIYLYGCDGCNGDGEDGEATTVEEPPVERGSYLDMTVNDRGQPLLSFYDSIETSLVHGRGAKKGAGIEFELATVDGAGEEDTGLFTSIAYRSEVTGISYYDRTNTALKYAEFVDGTWTPTFVDGEGDEDVGGYTSLAMGGDGKIFISYYDFTMGRLKLAERGGGETSFTLSIVDPQETDTYRAGKFSSLAINQDGEPVIAYMDETSGYLRVARREAGNFTIEVVDGVPEEYGCEWSSLAIEEDGAILVSYQRTDRRNLWLARYSEGAWTIQPVDESKYMGADSHILLLKSGSPAISYFDGTRNDLKFARYKDEGWDIETIASEGPVGYYNAVVQAPDDTLYFAWYDYYSKDFEFTTLLLSD